MGGADGRQAMTGPLARWALVALLIALGACARAAPGAPPAADAGAAPAATGASARTWLVADAEALIAALPAPAAEQAAPEAPADPSALDLWAEPASAWMGEGLRAIVADSASPVRAARALMLLAVALDDGLSVAAEARAAGREIADDAVMAEAAARVLAYTHPNRAEQAALAAETAAWAGVWRGEATASGVAAGRQLGALVAEGVIAWGAADGSLSLSPNVALPAPAAGVWEPTGPTYDQPDTPQWGRVRTVAIGDPAGLRAPAPPAWQSAEMRASYEAFVQAQRGLSAEDRALASKWAAGVGTVTPPGMWVQIARDLVAEHGTGTREAAAVYAALAVALHDGAVACWETKYRYWLARPQSAMQATEPGWRPFIKTPPHPSYPSGHATFSGAASAVLAAHFPDEAAWLAAQAEDAARSRVLGGIHWPVDSAAGLAQGRAVAERVLGRAGE